MFFIKTYHFPMKLKRTPNSIKLRKLSACETQMLVPSSGDNNNQILLAIVHKSSIKFGKFI